MSAPPPFPISATTTFFPLCPLLFGEEKPPEAKSHAMGGEGVGFPEWRGKFPWQRNVSRPRDCAKKTEGGETSTWSGRFLLAYLQPIHDPVAELPGDLLRDPGGQPGVDAARPHPDHGGGGGRGRAAQESHRHQGREGHLAAGQPSLPHAEEDFFVNRPTRRGSPSAFSTVRTRPKTRLSQDAHHPPSLVCQIAHVSSERTRARLPPATASRRLRGKGRP